jgi:L-ribulokinase
VAYDRLYAEYVALHDYLGRGANEVMRRLRVLRREALAATPSTTSHKAPAAPEGVPG